MIKNITLEEYMLNRMSHEPKEKYLESIGERLEDFDFIHLSVEGSRRDRNTPLLQGTELLLARDAINNDCKYVTDMDYCQYNPEKDYLIIAATGLIEKK